MLVPQLPKLKDGAWDSILDTSVSVALEYQASLLSVHSFGVACQRNEHFRACMSLASQLPPLLLTHNPPWTQSDISPPEVL